MITCDLASIKKLNENAFLLTLTNNRPTKIKILELVEAIQSVGNFYQLNVIIDVTMLRSFNKKERMLIDYYLQKYCHNVAIYAPNPMLYMISTMYIRLSSTRCNFSCFKDMNNALSWISICEKQTA